MDIRLDCLISSKKNKAYIINRHNKKRCQSLWMKDRERYFRIGIGSLDEAIKYNKKEEYKNKAIKVLNQRLEYEKKELDELLEEYNSSNYQHLFEDAISEKRSDIYSIEYRLNKFNKEIK